MTIKIKENINFSYLRNLPLLDFTASIYPDINFEKIYIICAQHLVSTTYSLFTKLLELGLKPENLSAIGKCYSTDPKAFDEMQKLGIDVCPSSLNFDSHESFDKQYQKNIIDFVKKRALKIKNFQFEKIIVLDDGGELISQINQLNDQSNFIGIEQTSAGYHKIKNKNLSFPVINLARSPAKLNYESPIIADLVISTLLQNLENLNFKPGKTLIIGNGPIGSQVYKKLQKTHQVFIYDKIPSKSMIPADEFDSFLKNFDLIIGCTGKPVLNEKQFNLLKNHAMLVSTSSSDREFSAFGLRKKLPKISDCHQTLKIENKWLVNCGFPINFSSDYRAIDSDELQLTRSLLLVSILQAIEDTNPIKKGFIPLDAENQREIIQEYYSLFKKIKLLIK